mgnify:CR=1 FL=1
MALAPPLKSSDLTSGTWSWISSSGTGEYGSWNSSTSSLNGWFWSTGNQITLEGTTYADSASVVLDANNNGIHDDVDYEIFYAYGGSTGGEQGSWTFNVHSLEGVVSGGAVGIVKSTVSFSYDLPNYNNSTIGTLNSDVITTYQGIDTIDARSGDDIINAGAGNDRIFGGDGSDTAVYSGKFNDYRFIRISDELRVVDLRKTNEDGEDTIKNIEFIEFSDQTVEESKVDVSKTYAGNFRDYKFYNKGNGKYEIKSDAGVIDDITGIPKLTFADNTSGISAIADIKGTFDHVTGLNTDSGEMFRLYNAAFARFPDADGLKYWIDEFSSGRNTRRVVSKSFLASSEFEERYGANITHETYVKNLYLNVLNRELDQSGYDYWVGNLNNGVEQRYEVLLGFSESDENKLLFTEMTGFA